MKVNTKNEMMKLENSLNTVMDVSEEMVADKYKSSLEKQNGVDSRLIFFDGIKDDKVYNAIEEIKENKTFTGAIEITPLSKKFYFKAKMESA